MNSRVTSRGGFTLIELIVSLSVVAILAALAVPGFQNMIAQGEMREASTALSMTFTRARSEATKRGTQITVIRNFDGWAGGWLIRDPAIPATLHQQQALKGVEFISSPPTVFYLSSGRVRPISGSPYEFEFKSTRIASLVRCVSIDSSGSPLIEAKACT